MIWFIIICCGLATFAARFLPLSGLFPPELPRPVRQAMRFVPVAVLSPIIVTGIFISPEGSLELDGNMRIWAAILASAIAIRTGNILLTLLSGLLGLWALQLAF